MKYELFLFPRLENGNILWTCDNCGNTGDISASKTRAVALYCTCTNSVHPECNNEWYWKGLYHNKELKKKYEDE